jgi:hypothetical protein
MIRSLLPMAALALVVAATPALAVTVTPPATKFQSSLTEPTPATGSAFHITKASSIQIGVSSGNVTFKLKLAGVVDGTSSPANQTNNTLQVDMVYGGAFHTQSFSFALANGKTDNTQTKFTVANSSLPGGGVLPDDSIQIVEVRCIQAAGSGAGANKNFCSTGLTAK